ncbi:MAG: branched-chain amino acid ABC transporter permease [Candidatus Tectomicrobia bacterium]|uniref:Branched-chain amino acid ABC transporter permease n=1 Tax=Tectimicrobiota bacterium TaxID=2528274 RepID=A0A937W130_UNCTE|nr:branched-chain amino acid ABC transporter permease [Candidatus Tectomicrobia bacterium]
MTASEIFTQQLINGLTTGSYLALIALGYTMVYGLIELINFAHGDIYALGFFLSLTLLTWLGVPRTLVAALPGSTLLWMLPVVMLLTMLGTGLVNVSLDRLAYKPLRRAPRIAVLITAVGASFALENLMQNWYGPSQVLYPNVLPDVNLARLALGESSSLLLSTKDVFLFSITMPMLGALVWFVRSTRLGKAIRAVAQDREAAAMMGINVERVIAMAFFLGGALAGAAGMVVGMYLNTGRYLMGFDVGLKAFTAAVLGGIGSLPGAVLGGYAIGLLSAFSDQYISSTWTRAVVFGILVLVLVFRPWGLLGQPPPERY